jgi:hypothetical protein
MTSYSSSNYSNGFYDLSGIYFNPVSSTSSIDITTLDERYLKLSGGTISNNLIITNSLDVQNSITLPEIGDVETEIQAKQDIINDGDLTIAKTNNLQSSLDTLTSNIDLKQDIINDGDLTISKTNNLQSSLDTLTSNIDLKQDIINDGDLTISKTNNLQSSLDTLQTNIDLKQDTISNLEINGNVNLDTSGTNFDTLVIRRVNGITGYTDNAINLLEVQIWVNNENLLVENSSTLTSFFSSWSDKETDIGFQTDGEVLNVYDGDLSNFTSWCLSPSDSPSDVALIIKNIPMTKINNIQSIQIANSSFSTLGNRAIGLTIELYNSINDPSYDKILSQSEEITAKWTLYRFDGPSLDTYTLGFGPSGIYPNTGSYSSLVSVEELSVFSFTFNIIGNMNIDSSLTVGDINIIDALTEKQDIINDGDLTIAKTNNLQSSLDTLQTNIDLKQDIINDGDLTIAKTNNLQSSLDTLQTNIDLKQDIITSTSIITSATTTSMQDQIDALINFTGGGINFRAYNVSNSSVSATQNLPYLTVDYDTDAGYDNTNYMYTIPIDGTYIFTFGWYVSESSTAVVNLIRKRGTTETIIQQSTNGTNQSGNSAFVGTTISECLQSDEIYVYLESGTLILNYGTTTETGASFSGARLSN